MVRVGDGQDSSFDRPMKTWQNTTPGKMNLLELTVGTLMAVLGPTVPGGTALKRQRL